ncbi:hypothetical protein ACNKHR_04955 [Shigella flexneri]
MTAPLIGYYSKKLKRATPNTRKSTAPNRLLKSVRIWQKILGVIKPQQIRFRQVCSSSSGNTSHSN